MYLRNAVKLSDYKLLINNVRLHEVMYVFAEVGP